jgi:hypothetical protein
MDMTRRDMLGLHDLGRIEFRGSGKNVSRVGHWTVWRVVFTVV